MNGRLEAIVLGVLLVIALGILVWSVAGCGDIHIHLAGKYYGRKYDAPAVPGVEVTIENDMEETTGPQDEPGVRGPRDLGSLLYE